MKRAIQYNTNKIGFYLDVVQGDMKAFVSRELDYIKRQGNSNHALEHSRIVLQAIGQYQGYNVQVA